MKKLLTLLVLLTLTSCMKDDIMEPVFVSEVPEALLIDELVGIKLESVIVSSEVRMNVKLPNDGTYRVKIRDIDNSLISQEKLTAQEGDNILSVYTSSLDKSSFTLELTDVNHNVIGRTVFVNQ
jgi:hypothetical protein|tara:strand:- start:1268 stop:1639 length:372 start_codon:yes stop_codon:yes gene_type:complete